MGNIQRFSELSEAAKSLWAKTQGDAWHGILPHWLDVAAAAEALLYREPAASVDWIARELGLDRRSAIRWIAALIGLHDFGKATPGFIKKWPPGLDRARAAGLRFPLADHGDHGLATTAMLPRELRNVADVPVSWCQSVAAAVGAHHGFHHSRSAATSAEVRTGGSEWALVRAELLRAYWQALAPSGVPLRDTIEITSVNWLAGLTSVADWIGSNTQWFGYGYRGEDRVEAYFQSSLAIADRALDEIGWQGGEIAKPVTSDLQSMLRMVLGKPEASLRQLQLAGGALLAQAAGPSLLLVEAPMGEGKTELAYLAHWILQARNGHRGLFVAMPTQATSNAMFERTQRYLRSVLGDSVATQLVHGGASVAKLTVNLEAIGGTDKAAQENAAASEWFSQKKRPLLCPNGVGTVDQSLLAVLNVKHHFVRMWGLANRVIVLDEVHAYQTYTTGLIAAMLRWLRKLGCSVIIMSATLPRARRRELLEAWGVNAPDTDAPYPRVLLASDQVFPAQTFACRALSPIAIRGVPEGLDDIAELARKLAISDGCGVIIVNTVKRAQELYQKLRDTLDADTELLLFHARFPADQRTMIERAVVGKFGENGERPKRSLLIATQVVEQSLDLDFDYMVTDLAPIDLILQRLGRLHRHVRSRPAGRSVPNAWVAGLHAEQLPNLKTTAWGFVYDPYILALSWVSLRQIVTNDATIQLPADIDPLVQAVYDVSAEVPDWVEASVREYIEISAYGEHLAKVGNERRMAINAALSCEGELSEVYACQTQDTDDDSRQIAKTRLGPDSVTLIPIPLTDGKWPFDSTQRLSADVATQLYATQIKVSHPAVVKHFNSTQQPECFTGSPILRHCHPLLIEGGRCDLSHVVLLLDPKLGLVIGSQNNQ